MYLCLSVIKYDNYENLWLSLPEYQFCDLLKKKKKTTNLKYKFPLATKDAPEFLLLVTCQ